MAAAAERLAGHDLPVSAPRIALALVLLPVLAWAAFTAALWWTQESLLFHPQPLPDDTRLATEPDVHERFVDVPGARLSVLDLRLPEPRGVVFFLHGNAGNLQSWFTNTEFYRRAGFDLVMPDYRGYGKSTGRIESEAQLHADVMAVWRSIAPRYAGKRIVFYGRSLGTGLAAELAATVQPDLTVLVSPYASIVGMARGHYPWLPPQVVRSPLRTDRVIGRIRGPLLLVHGDRDEVIPFSESAKLQAVVPQARLVRIAGGGHNDLQDLPAYRQAVTDALAALR
ncbi:alpha/beta hydrolase [Roseateles sp. LYH14W]|uniref:Alpha/beta hydrolase n=1 Tax=Pelomonas parva TaxID=3299032 RepID=A0ABW7EWR3_9BURK